MECHICGRNDDLVNADVEGVILEVCSGCARFGKILRKPASQQLARAISQPRRLEPEELKAVVADAGARIKSQREKLGLTQEQLARKVAERESIIQKAEAQTIELSLSLAKKLEKQLGIALIEEAEPAVFIPAKNQGGGMTLGDVIKKKAAGEH